MKKWLITIMLALSISQGSVNGMKRIKELLLELQELLATVSRCFGAYNASGKKWCDMVDEINPEELFIIAVHVHDLEYIKKFLDIPGFNPNIVFKGFPVILFAIARPDVPTVKLLLSHWRFDPNQQDLGGNTALHWLIREYNNSMSIDCLLLIEILLSDARTRCDIKNDAGETIYYSTHYHKIRKMISEKAQRDFMALVFDSEHAKVKNLLEVCSSFINVNAIHFGRTALSYAVVHLDVEMVKLLLSCEFLDPNVCGQYGNTVLHLLAGWASASGQSIYFTLLKLLLMDLRTQWRNVPNHKGKTAYDLATCDSVRHIFRQREKLFFK